MKSFRLSIFIICIITITGLNYSYGFSICKPLTNKEPYEILKHFTATELLKLSSNQFFELTGRKMNMWNRLAFHIAKKRLKHDLIKNPQLKLSDYSYPKYKKSLVLKILSWVIGIILGLLLIFAIAYSGAKR